MTAVVDVVVDAAVCREKTYEEAILNVLCVVIEISRGDVLIGGEGRRFEADRELECCSSPGFGAAVND